MRSRPRFLTDADEVLVDFQTPTLDVMERVTGVRREPHDFNTWDIFTVLTPEQLEAVFAEIQSPGYCSRLQPLPGAVEGLREIQKFADVYVVTSPFFGASTWSHERTTWLGDHFGISKEDIVHTRAKHLVVGDALLDDKPDNVLSWAEHHPDGDAMLWHIPNTRNLGHEDRRVNSWEDVARRLKDAWQRTVK